MKPTDVKSNWYVHFVVENNDENPKVGDYVYHKHLSKVYKPHWSEESYVIENIQNTVPWTYFKEDLNGEETVWTCYEKEL